MEKKHTQGQDKRPVLAVCYDFDKTLTPEDMQAQGYIQAVHKEVQEFWSASNGLAKNQGMDQNLAYMFMMKQEAEGNLVFTKETLADYGAKISFFPGVESWFARINAYGEKQGIEVEHYVISSGLKEMIEGTSLACKKVFKQIYASSFYYNEKGVAVWPAQVVNYTNKTQFLFRIKKGVLDVSDAEVNDVCSPEHVHVPFRNMVYIGDSDTDIPCMTLVNRYGGYSIGVFDPETKDKAKVYKMMHDQRIRYFASADYSDGQELDQLLKGIINRTAATEYLEAIAERQKQECHAVYLEHSEEEQKKKDLILALANSRNFSFTHKIIQKMQTVAAWDENEKTQLFDIAVKNYQVRYILMDSDIHDFYEKLLNDIRTPTKEMEELQAILSEE